MKKILIADDEKALRLLVSGTLEVSGHEIIETDNGDDAVKTIEKEKPDMVILDVMMPGMSGYEVCKYIKSQKNLKHIKVLILTAKGQQSDKGDAKAANADYYLAKPFSPAELIDIVKEILG